MANDIITVPDIGSDDPVDVIELLVAEGDDIQVDDSLLVLESAKASVEVPSPKAGKVGKLLVKVGDRVNAGDKLLELQLAAESTPVEETEAQAAEPEPEPLEAHQPQAPEPQAATQSQPSTPEVNVNAAEDEPPASSRPVHAGPAVRKLARKLGVDLAQLGEASGQHSRILKADVHAYVKQRLQAPTGVGLVALPEVDFSQFGEVWREPTSNLQRTAARHLQQGWQQIPQVTQHELVDVTELEAFRKAENQRRPDSRLSLLAFVAKAVSHALTLYPRFKSSLSASGDELIMKSYTHLGFAVDTERGLLVPVLRDADQLGVAAIAEGVASLAEKARSRQLTPRDMQGACFTLSSLGGIGGTHFTPLVNHPQVAILGLSRADWQPQWQADKGEFVPRLMLPLSLSYDHRVIDGADAARFVVLLRELLADVRRLLL